MKLPLPSRFIRLCRPGGEGYAQVGPRQIYIFPTGFGFLFALLLCLMLIGSINYSNNLGFLLTFLLAGLGLVAMIHTWRNLVGLHLGTFSSPPAFKGERARYQLILKNTRRAERPGLCLEFEKGNIARCDLGENSSHNVSLHSNATARGWQLIPRIVASTQYPLGLFTAWTYIQLDASTLVYPAPGTAAELILNPTYRQSKQGNKGVGVEDFVGLRPYRAGDSPKHINWKAVAREQALQTKQFGGDRSEQLWLDWDHLSGGDTEQKLSQLCGGVIDASSRGLEFGLRLPDKEISPALELAHQQRCLSALALFDKSP